MKDSRITQLEDEKALALQNIQDVYNGLQADNTALYNKQQDYANQQLETQNAILDKQLNYNLDLINQQKDTAKESLQNEQIKAENDYKKFVNPYGANAESMANNGLLNTGYAETTQLGAFNVWQNRNANAKASYDKAILAYDNDMNQARLTNDTTKAQNALNKLKLELDNLQGYFNNKSSLATNQLSATQDTNSDYFNRISNVYNQLLNEKQFNESVRQYNQNFKYQKERDKVADAQWQKQYNLSRSKSSGGSSKSSSKKSSSKDTGLQLTNNSKESSSKTVRSDRTPVLSSNKAQQWFAKLPLETTEDNLVKEVSKAVDNKLISNAEADKIFYAYGYR